MAAEDDLAAREGIGMQTPAVRRERDVLRT
jgi:hypothetical protein